MIRRQPRSTQGVSSAASDVYKRQGKGRGKPVIGYSFTWKPEKKDANDFSQGQFQDERQKLFNIQHNGCLLYTSPSPRDATLSRMPSSA